MKTTLKFALAAATAATACLAFAFGAFTNFVKAEQPRADRAFETKNIKWFEEISTPDFTYTTAQGQTQKKKEALAGIKQMFDMSDTIDSSTKVLNITETANGGTCRLESVFKAKLKPGPDKKVHTMVATSWTHEVWVKSGKGYRIKSIKEVKPSKMLMDGKPMPAGMGGH